jgi:hypothetical protein
MRSIGLKSGILQISLLFISCFLLVSVCHAQGSTSEQITITTYYPSPYGVYQSLEARRMVIGSTPTTSMPTDDGVIHFQSRNAVPGATDGALFYGSGHVFSYYNSNKWVILGPCYSETWTTSCGTGYAQTIDAGWVNNVIGLFTALGKSLSNPTTKLCCPNQ